MKANNPFAKRNCLLVIVFLMACLLLGSFFDEEISSVLYNQSNIFGIFLASYGQLPAMLCCSVGGLLFMQYGNDKPTTRKYTLYMIGILLHIFAVLGITMDPMLYMKGIHVAVSAGIAIVVVLFVDITILKISKDCDKTMMKKVAITLISVMLLEMIIINVIKIPWGRPRMRLLMDNEQAMFQPWWEIGSAAKDQLMALGVASEEFKSFPSGHTGNAACAMLLSILPLLSTKLKGKENTFFYCGFSFAVLVAVSRLIMGAHFLSDVTIGMCIAFLISTIFVNRYIYKKYK